MTEIPHLCIGTDALSKNQKRKKFNSLVGWFYRRPHTSYSLLGVVQLPTDVRIHGDTHRSVLRVLSSLCVLSA